MDSFNNMSDTNTATDFTYITGSCSLRLPCGVCMTTNKVCPMHGSFPQTPIYGTGEVTCSANSGKTSKTVKNAYTKTTSTPVVTNYDYLQSLGLKEFAKVLGDGACPGFDDETWECRTNEHGEADCKVCVLEWLSSEARV